MSDPGELRFEDALTKLEAIVREMESGSLGLDEGIKKFEEGIALARFCECKLGDSQKKIEILMKQEAGSDAEWTTFKEPVESER